MGILEILAKPMDIKPGKAKHEGKLRAIELRDKTAAMDLKEDKATWNDMTRSTRFELLQSQNTLGKANADVATRTKDYAVDQQKHATTIAGINAKKHQDKVAAELAGVRARTEQIEQKTKEAQYVYKETVEFDLMSQLFAAVNGADETDYPQRIDRFARKELSGKSPLEVTAWFDKHSISLNYQGEKTIRRVQALDQSITADKEQLQLLQKLRIQNMYDERIAGINAKAKVAASMEYTPLTDALHSAMYVDSLDVPQSIKDEAWQAYRDLYGKQQGEVAEAKSKVVNAAINQRMGYAEIMKVKKGDDPKDTDQDTFSRMYRQMDLFIEQEKGDIDKAAQLLAHNYKFKDENGTIFVRPRDLVEQAGDLREQLMQNLGNTADAQQVSKLIEHLLEESKALQTQETATHAQSARGAGRATPNLFGPEE